MDKSRIGTNTASHYVTFKYKTAKQLQIRELNFAVVK